jgi:post-segregation antitoxin (ccd killing protein)
MVKPGSLTTMGFKTMLTPDGPKSMKFSNGQVVDIQGEESAVTEAQTVGDITFDNGVITRGGKKIGTAMKSLQHGYHPSIELKLANGYNNWYELDADDLMQTIVNDINANLGSGSPAAAKNKVGGRPGIKPNIKRESQDTTGNAAPTEKVSSIIKRVMGNRLRFEPGVSKLYKNTRRSKTQRVDDYVMKNIETGVKQYASANSGDAVAASLKKELIQAGYPVYDDVLIFSDQVMFQVRTPITVTAETIKQRLDPKCWKGKHIGNPKTNVKGGVRVNNCVPNESVAEAERNELDTPAVQAALARMAERHRGEKWSKEQLAALGKRIAARGQKTVKEDVTKEDVISKLKAKLGDYLSDLSKEIKSDPDLVDKLAAKAPGDQMGPPVKTVTTDDGHEIQIHGNEDDGFRISIKNKQSASKFANVDEAVMACEMYCARRRSQTLNADYVEEA